MTVLADPLKYVLHHLGFVACLLLATVLTFTPLRVLFPQSEIVRSLNRHRTLVGVSAFVYAALHFTTHLVYEGGVAILKSDVKKPFLLTGLTTFTILLVLAATSPHAVLRALGGRLWKRIHRFAYVAAALAAYHQSAARKVFSKEAVWIFAPLAVLELLRIVRQRMPGKPPPTRSPAEARSSRQFTGSNSSVTSPGDADEW